MADRARPDVNLNKSLTKAQFAKAQIAQNIKDVVSKYEAGKAADTARKTAQDNASLIVIT